MFLRVEPSGRHTENVKPAVLISSLFLLACVDEPQPPPEGPHYQYVVSDLHIPQTSTEAREYGLDLNEDKTVDNQLGMVFATLDGMGLGVDDTARESLARGGMIMLADLQTPSFDTADGAGVTTYLGAEPTPTPCIDAADLATCRQHLAGDGQFSVQPESASDLAVGPFDDGRFVAGMDRLPVELVIVDPEPIHVVLHAARIRVIAISPTGGTAVIGGGITKADIDGVVIPEAAAQIDRIVHNECAVAPFGSCTCASSRAKTLQGIFDINPRDCRVSVEEVGTNSIVVSLLAPDLRVNGVDLLSFSAGVDLVSATFPTL